jgi:hypothetical protein
MPNQPPQHASEGSQRQADCRAEIEAAMQWLVAGAVRRGWTTIEIAMALADASEGLVMQIAQEMRRAP